MARNTQQKAVIADCFNSSDGPLTPAEVHALASKKLPSMGIATVYRAVSSLRDSGLLTAVTIGGKERFELNEADHHFHFYCHSCDRAYCIENCPVTLDSRSLAPDGFVVEGHDLIVDGVCDTCNRQDG